MKHNHYSIELDTEEPTTGVYNGNDIAYECLDDYGLDPDYGRYCYCCGEELPEAEAEKCPTCGEGLDWDFVDWESSTLLYGDWKQDADGLWEPDKTGEYAAIHNVNDNTIQVVWSQFVRYGIMCSPCYPGQADAQVDDPQSPDGDHYQAYYALPDDLIRRD